MAISLGGLASNLDTNAMIESLVKIESASITAAQSRQAAYRSQVSQLGDLVSKLKALGTAAASLKTSGALGLSQSGTTSGFSVTPGTTATAGRYSVLVDALAQAAKARSADFTSGDDVVKAGTLDLSVDGTSTQIQITEGMTLSAVAQAINDSGAAVSAVVLQSNGKAVLSVTNTNTGFTPGNDPATALSITETSTGTTGTALGLAVTQAATNAKVTIDNMQFERASNTIADALPGVTLTLKAKTTVAEDLVLSTDTAATSKKLGDFVSAYNDVMKILRSNLNIGEDIDRTKTLGGDGALRSIQASLMGMISSVANVGSAIQSLAELGVRSQGDASLKVDEVRLAKALATDPAAVNDVFQKATLGISDKIDTLVKSYADSTSGILVSKSKSYDNTVRQIDKQIESLQLRIEAYRTRLVNQFAAMEKVVSNFKSIGNYLTSQEKQSTSK